MKPDEKPEVQEAILTPDSTFSFACHDTLPCFTQCCKDVNIYLTPYDILRLRRALGIRSGEVLAQYTRSFLAVPSHIPFVQLLMDPETLRCKLVTEDGCSVYENRPWACRIYPLDLAGEPGTYRTIVGRERCLGLREGSARRVDLYLQSQGIDETYTEMDEAFQAVMPRSSQPGSVKGEALASILALAYDLDRFAAMLQDESFRSSFELDEEAVRGALENDEALLRLALRYIRSELEEMGLLP